MASSVARPFTSRAQRALEFADAAAAGLHVEYIGTEHLLLGLLADERSPAAQILQELGVSSDAIRQAVQRAQSAPPTGAS
jgi:ATP-dependent Clp protease ATP-binding subunit ClpC